MSYCVKIPLLVIMYNESAMFFFGLYAELDISLTTDVSSTRPWEKHVDTLMDVAIPVSSGFSLLYCDRIWHSEWTIIECGIGDTHGLEYGNEICEFCGDSVSTGLFRPSVIKPALR